MSNKKIIHGVGIKIDHPDYKDKSVEELKTLETFNHLSEKEQDDAYKELHSYISSPEEKEEKEEN